jgi:uncharacterized phosphosugar-binding protein
MFEIADVVLDNGSVPGDAVVNVEGAPGAAGATSTVIGAALLEAIIVQTVADLVALGQKPPIFVSSNLDGNDQHNLTLAQAYNERVPGLMKPLFPNGNLRESRLNILELA